MSADDFLTDDLLGLAPIDVARALSGEQEDEDLAPVGETIWSSVDARTFYKEIRTHIEQGKLPKTRHNLPQPFLSVSQVELYLKCPKQYEFRYIKGIRSPPSVALVQGTTIHKAVEIGYQYVIDKGELPPVELALDTFHDHYRENMSSDVIRQEHESDAFNYAYGEKLLTIWHKDKLPTVKPVMVEQQFIVPIYDIPVIGGIDLIDGAPHTEGATDNVVVDNKVVGKKYSQNDVDSMLQMSLYSAAARLPNQRYDLFIKPNEDYLKNPNSKAKGPRIEPMKTIRTASDILWMARIFKEVAQAISAGNFPPTSPTSWTCSASWCGFWRACRGRQR